MRTAIIYFVNERNLLLRLGEDNQLVLVLLQALNVGLDGLNGGIAAAVVDGNADGQGLLDARLGERLLLTSCMINSV